MAYSKREKSPRHLYTIYTHKRIDALGGIFGPVLKPTSITEADALNLIKDGATVYCHNPYNTTEKILVTRQNWNNIKFTTTRGDMIRKNAAISEKRNKIEKSITKVADVKETKNTSTLSGTDFEITK